MKSKYPLKRFGQNYLRDENIIRKIINEISPKTGDVILEIGPGEGALTKHLVNQPFHFIAVEIDNRNAKYLEEKFPELYLRNNDFLEIDLNEFHKNFDKKLRIIGNIPYNITSPIIFKLIENRGIIKDSIIMIQQEVAERIIAKPGNKDYGILSVITQNFAKVNICFKVSSGVFYPRPKVNSSVIHINFQSGVVNKKYDEMFIKVVKAAFGNRRKMLCNSLKNSIFEHLNFNQTGIDLTLRAEKLSIDDFHKLTQFAFEHAD
ncbi:MAG: ribosomal RNA small subunit methyltransferase A [Ignavibacteriaceae bacterium]|nr:ribosomal RNA small subunit methyltransferase A [Ignavibacteriaceae bacterium]